MDNRLNNILLYNLQKTLYQDVAEVYPSEKTFVIRMDFGTLQDIFFWGIWQKLPHYIEDG